MVVKNGKYGGIGRKLGVQVAIDGSDSDDESAEDSEIGGKVAKNGGESEA